jgi:tRNA A37 N6-isopentenylltransferase MiaA
MSKKRGRPPKAETIKPEPVQEQCAKSTPYRTELMLLNPADAGMASRIERRLNEMYAQGYEYAGNIRWSEVEIVMVYFRGGDV